MTMAKHKNKTKFHRMLFVNLQRERRHEKQSHHQIEVLLFYSGNDAGLNMAKRGILQSYTSLEYS